jgi:hypothetical protein
VSQYECELVLRENDHEKRIPHTFLAEVHAGTFLRLEERNWIITEIQEGDDKPLVICRPPSES